MTEPIDPKEKAMETPCYGREAHRWGEPRWSPFFGCAVKCCGRCDRVVEVPRSAVPRD